MGNDYQRKPTDVTSKQLALDLLENTTILYQKVFSGLQMAQIEGKSDSQLIKNLNEYASCIMSLYKMLKTKIRIVDAQKEKYKDLEFCDKYLYVIKALNITVDNVDSTFILFQILNICEDKLRELCDELGYTSDKPKQE